MAPIASPARRRRASASATAAWVLEILRRNVWVTPYYRENLAHLAEPIGVGSVLFGSDWPHAEGLAEPVRFVKELGGFSDTDIRAVMRENALELLGSGASGVPQ